MVGWGEKSRNKQCVCVFCFFFFFFKQKTAYEISGCLVGSEMCKGDRAPNHSDRK